MTSPPWRRLCRLNELEETASRGFQAMASDATCSIFIVRKNNQVHGYVNSCPHTGAPLEWLPNQFLSLDNEEIQCALHGARFRIENGLCVSGPCVGASLTPIELEIKKGWIVWNPATHPDQ